MPKIQAKRAEPRSLSGPTASDQTAVRSRSIPDALLDRLEL